MYWQVELSLVSLVGRTMSRGVIRRGCLPRMTLGKLSAGMCAVFSPCWFFYLEASQHWSLPSTLWDQVSFPKWRPPRKLLLRIIPSGFYLQYPAPIMSHSQPLPPQDTLQGPHLGLAQISMESLLCPGTQYMWKLLCALQRWIFPLVQWSSYIQAPLAFKAKCSGGSPTPIPDPKVREPQMGFRTLTPVWEPLR